MSSDPRDYQRYSTTKLPPLREVLADAWDTPPSTPPHRRDLDDDNRARSGTPKHDRYPCPPQQYPPERGPTLPPLRFLSLRDGRGPSPSNIPGRISALQESTEPTTYTTTTPTSPQPATGPSSYSYNVLRTQQGDLVDVRTPSSRAQGILRPTAIIEDEDDSHKRYKCGWPGCDKKYDRPSSLEVHRHTHTGDQPYQCAYPGCNRAFNVKSNMLRHLRSHPEKTRRSGREKAREPGGNDTDHDDDSYNWPPEPSSSSRPFHQIPSDYRLPLSPGSTSKFGPMQPYSNTYLQR